MHVSPPSERAIQHAILEALGTRPDLRLWRANTGVAQDQATGQVIRFGVKGQADLTGILLPSGRRLEVEVKGQRGTQTPEQRSYQAMIERHGGLYVLARSVEDVLRAVEEAQGLI